MYDRYILKNQIGSSNFQFYIIIQTLLIELIFTRQKKKSIINRVWFLLDKKKKKKSIITDRKAFKNF